MIRTFIAIRIPCSQNLQLEYDKIRTLLESSRIRWTRPDQFHFTLKFLGNTNIEMIPMINNALSLIAENTAPFHLRVTGAGIFKNIYHPRVLWLNLEDEQQELARLKSQIEKAIVPFGFPEEDRNFTPHLTLGRIVQSHRRSELQSVFDLANGRILQENRVDRIMLFQSLLSSSEPVYQELGSFGLTGKWM